MNVTCLWGSMNCSLAIGKIRAKEEMVIFLLEEIKKTMPALHIKVSEVH